MKDIVSNEKFDNGSVNISSDVISIVASLAAKEVDGVVKISTGITGEITEILGMKNLAKGVEVEIDENDVVINLAIGIKYGIKIKDVAFEVQSNVKEAVETMTGLNVKEVNINIQEVVFTKKEETIEEKQNN